MSFDWGTLVTLGWSSGKLTLTVGPLAQIAVGVLLAIATTRTLLWRRRSDWGVEEFELSLGLWKGKVKRTPSVVQLAHEAWVELATRSATVPFDEDRDVVVQVFDSWRSLFQELRVLMKKVDVTRHRDDQETQQVIDALIDTLNQCMRPTLTTWQAAFRCWYEQETARRPGIPPQEIQREYPKWEQLVTDVKKANATMRAVAADMRALALGKSGKLDTDSPTPVTRLAA